MVKAVYKCKKTNKIVSLILSAMMLIPQTVFAEDDVTNRTEIEAAGFLTNLQIADNWDCDDFVDRAEFVNAVIRRKQMQDSIEGFLILRYNTIYILREGRICRFGRRYKCPRKKRDSIIPFCRQQAFLFCFCWRV